MSTPSRPLFLEALPEPTPNPPQPSARSDQESGRALARSSPTDDKALLERVLARDQTAMAEIFDRYSGMVFSIAMRVVKDAAQAEDVMQDVFFQVWQNPRAFVSDRGSLGAWLAVVGRNRAIDAIRRRKPSDPVEDVVLPSATNVAAEVEHRTMLERVRSAMNNLPPEQRESVELAFFEGMTHAEIAQKKGEPLGTVKTRIRTALMSVRKAVKA
ncbi:sigma-70 family RNA polymerase sigma factor [Acidobacteria bacterium AB60]|nr:sigma-70 family RNA polymerase sigma factor [Acidobacteria bacterium AB60]